MLRRVLTLLLTAAVLLSCQSGKKPASVESVSTYWQRHDWHLDEDLDITEGRFAEFAELATAAPKEEAIAALGALLDSLKAKDEVAYYIYIGWMDGVFYSPESPCRDKDLYTYTVNRIEQDGVLDPEECEPYRQRRRWIAINQTGEQAIVPEAELDGRRTLVLVASLGCPICLVALDNLLSDPQWDDCRHVALCSGYEPLPDTPGWEYYALPQASRFFDVQLTPFYYVVDADGIVEKTYTPAL